MKEEEALRLFAGVVIATNPDTCWIESEADVPKLAAIASLHEAIRAFRFAVEELPVSVVSCVVGHCSPPLVIPGTLSLEGIAATRGPQTVKPRSEAEPKAICPGTPMAHQAEGRAKRPKGAQPLVTPQRSGGPQANAMSRGPRSQVGGTEGWRSVVGRLGLYWLGGSLVTIPFPSREYCQLLEMNHLLSSFWTLAVVFDHQSSVARRTVVSDRKELKLTKGQRRATGASGWSQMCSEPVEVHVCRT